MITTQFEIDQNREFPYEWIGQGYGYKNENYETEDEIIYIPEYAYVDGHAQYGYSFKDFLDICEGYRKRAEFLFQLVDWQHPESAYDEIDFDGDEEWNDE